MENSNIEILRGSPKTSIWKISIPIMITTMVTTIYNVIDGLWVIGLGYSAIAAIGLVTPLWMIINGVANGLANGVASSIPRLREKYGDDEANTVAGQSIIIFIIVSIMISIILLLALNPFLNMYNASAQVSIEAISYGTPLFLCSFLFIFSSGFGGIFRSEGDTKRAMYATSFGMVLNAILDPIFIYVFNWGSAGAAIATCVASLVTMLIFVYWMFFKKDTYISIDIKGLLKSKWDWFITKDILNTGIPATALLIFFSLSAVALYYLINLCSGELGLGIYSSGYRLYLLCLVPVIGISSALIPIAGTHYGAGNIKYLKQAHSYAISYAFIIAFVVCTLFAVFSDQLAYMLVITTKDFQLISGISLFIKICVFAIPFLAIGWPSSYLYQGLGKGTHSFIWSSLYEIFTIGMAYLFAFYLNYGLIGIWFGFVGGKAIIAILNLLFARYSINSIK